MKKLLLTLLCLAFFSHSNAQKKSEIANIYINRANTVIEESIDFKKASVLFEKAIKYLDTITNSSIANLGARIYFELENYSEAQKLSKQYFLIVKDKKSEEYMQQLELFVAIGEALERQRGREIIQKRENLKKEKEQRRIDSLKIIWKEKSQKFSIEVDSIYPFNANNFALFNRNGKLGIINDKAEIIIEAKDYNSSVSYAGFILLKNKEENPTEIYAFNTNNSTGALLPNPSDFNLISTHFGKVMLPRSDGTLVTYPNNANEPMIYNLNQNKIVRNGNSERALKYLKNKGLIKKYNTKNEVKIDQSWYIYGGHIGGGIHPLYTKNNYDVHAFLCAIDGTILFTTSNYDYIGAFSEGSAQAIKGNIIFWVNQNGTKISQVIDKKIDYYGEAKVVKVAKGIYQIVRDNEIIKGNETLEKMEDFLDKS
jgi:hypothetical protein